jgi:hypothetical protein
MVLRLYDSIEADAGSGPAVASPRHHRKKLAVDGSK